jgi:REP element-mobilizing transposase RayT
MQKENLSINLRKPLRLATGNYKNPGMYFLTICSFETRPVFGKISNNHLTMNPAGNLVMKWWEKLPSKFSRIILGDFVVMPNHFHGIIIIEPIVGEDPRVLPPAKIKWEDKWVLPYDISSGDREIVDTRVAPSVPRIMQWFKTMSTNEFLRMEKETGSKQFQKLWQRSYYDHIIRNNTDHQRISDYIRNNPARWVADRFNRP